MASKGAFRAGGEVCGAWTWAGPRSSARLRTRTASKCELAPRGQSRSLPAAPESLIQLDQASIFISPRSCERQFRSVKRPLAVKNFEIGRRATLVAKRGDADSFLQIRNAILLACPYLMQFLVAD